MRLTATALAISITGCSFVFVDGPPKNHSQRPSFDCSSSHAVPVLDAVFAALEIANFALAAYDTDQDWNDTYKNQAPFSRKTGLAIYGVLAALGASGSYYGFDRTTACREAKAELAARQARQPAPVVPGWPPPPLAPVAPVAPPPPETPPPAPAPETPATP